MKFPIHGKWKNVPKPDRISSCFKTSCTFLCTRACNAISSHLLLPTTRGQHICRCNSTWIGEPIWIDLKCASGSAYMDVAQCTCRTRRKRFESGNTTVCWLVVSTPLENIHQLRWLFPIYVFKLKVMFQTTNQFEKSCTCRGWDVKLPTHGRALPLVTPTAVMHHQNTVPWMLADGWHMVSDFTNPSKPNYHRTMRHPYKYGP